jgi:signal peptidase I
MGAVTAGMRRLWNGALRRLRRESRVVPEVEARARTETPRRPKSHLREYIEAIGVALLLALGIRHFIVQAFRIPSGSMEDTLLVGDFLLANKFLYGPKIPFTDVRLPGLSDMQPGDIMIFAYPEEPSKDFIKRCVAVEGQTVEIRDKRLYVDGQPFINPPKVKYTDARAFGPAGSPRDNFGPITVRPRHLFMMGDNRDNSRDSRYWGELHTRFVKGKAMILYWSWRPDMRAPRYAGPLSLPYMLVYNIIRFPQRVRWERLADIIR